MKSVIHRADERGGADHGWLKTRHSFSFAHWYEPTRMGFGALRVINDDWIAPHMGFAPHGHKDMEIVTIVTSGTLTHEDSMGNLGVIPAGDVQIMSAGSGVTHSERNDGDEPLTLFQIWIEAKEKGIVPRYGQESLRLREAGEGLTLLVGPIWTPHTLTINQDACIYYASINPESSITFYSSHPERGIYFFVIDGDVTLAGESLGPRDAMGATEVKEIDLKSSAGAHLLIFDVPM
jgi:quercetin 2,3-dioxygenase